MFVTTGLCWLKALLPHGCISSGTNQQKKKNSVTNDAHFALKQTSKWKAKHVTQSNNSHEQVLTTRPGREQPSPLVRDNTATTQQLSGSAAKVNR